MFCSYNWSEMWHALLHYEANMWFYHVLLHFWLRLGDSEALVRSLSALFAAAAVPLLYFLGRRLFDHRAGSTRIPCQPAQEEKRRSEEDTA